MVVIMVDAGETVLVNLPQYKVNDERLCRSTQWVVSLNTALSPSSCVVIQEEECNHTLGSLTPLDLVPHPVSNPRSRSSSQVLVGCQVELVVLFLGIESVIGIKMMMNLHHRLLRRKS